MFGVINIFFLGLLNLVFTGGDRGYFLDVGGVGRTKWGEILMGWVGGNLKLYSKDIPNEKRKL